MTVAERYQSASFPPAFVNSIWLLAHCPASSRVSYFSESTEILIINNASNVSAASLCSSRAAGMLHCLQLSMWEMYLRRLLLALTYLMVLPLPI